ncbi:hypothetical protein HanRHA438_Chr05g0223691 [Helianthus annuus]|nr:hypothetical protein HanRHA438_Chr05g0223691 [Helianthus annuus]
MIWLNPLHTIGPCLRLWLKRRRDSQTQTLHNEPHTILYPPHPLLMRQSTLLHNLPHTNKLLIHIPM